MNDRKQRDAKGREAKDTDRGARTASQEVAAEAGSAARAVIPGDRAGEPGRKGDALTPNPEAQESASTSASGDN